MEPISIGLTLFFALCTGAVVWWLVQAEMGLRSLRTELAESHGANAARMSAMQARLDGLVQSAEALSRAHPGLAGVVEAHRVLDRLEAVLSGAGDNDDIRTAAADVLCAVRGMLAGRESEGDLAAPVAGDAGLLHLFLRIRNTLAAIELSVTDLGLNELEARRLGEVAFLAGDRNWAESCYVEAARLSPRCDATLRSLHLLSNEAGDDYGVRIHLEGLLENHPDDPLLLREHARLLTRMGDSGAERDLKRLEAMGIENAEDKSMLAALAARSGDNDAALEAVEAAIAAGPSRTDWVRKAELHLARGEPGLGLTAVDEALALDRQCGRSWSIRAQLLKGDVNAIDDALKAVTHAVALGEDMHLLKAELLERAGRAADAVDSLEKALAADPEHVDLRAHLALIRHQNGDADAAFRLIEEAPVSAWSKPGLHIQKGRLILAEADRHRDGTGDRDRELLSEADIAFDAALRIDRENGVAWLGKARIQRMCGDLEEATISLTRARRLLPEEPLISAEEALLALDAGDVEAASRAINQAQVKERDSTVIAYVKGVIAARRGDLSEATRMFDGILRQDPGHVRARLNRATAKMLMERHNEALDDANLLIESHPELDLARLRRGEILMTLGEWATAENDFRAVIDRRGQHPQALTWLGASLIAQERLSEAEAPLNDAIMLDGDNAEGWYQRGLLYLEFGQSEGAVADFETAVTRDPHHMNALLRIAAIHHETSSWAAAGDAVIRIDVEHTTPRLLRRRIEEAAAAQEGEDEILTLTIEGDDEA